MGNFNIQTKIYKKKKKKKKKEKKKRKKKRIFGMSSGYRTVSDLKLWNNEQILQFSATSQT